MSATLRVPPGRAGRLWLDHRVAVANRAAELLDQKLRILRAERERRALVEMRTRSAWEAAARDADTWLARLAQLEGRRAIRLAAAREPAEVEVRWEQAVGVRYPGSATVRAGRAASQGGTATLAETRRRVAVALDAAVQHAAATAALRALEAQEAATRRRLRSIRTRYLPLLEETLHAVEVALEEDERSDLLRLRWAAARTGRS
jgi:V/A-type H+-transporting ATPase subunit D